MHFVATVSTIPIVITVLSDIPGLLKQLTKNAEQNHLVVVNTQATETSKLLQTIQTRY